MGKLEQSQEIYKLEEEMSMNNPDLPDHHPSCPEADDYVCPRLNCRPSVDSSITGEYIHDILSYDSEDIDRTEECPESHDCKCDWIYDGLAIDAAESRYGI